MQNNKRDFILIKKTIEAEDITSLFFQTVDDLKFEYTSGQYIVFKPGTFGGRGKSYTISSDPSEEYICLTIKRKGEVSSALIDLNVGDKVLFEGPYGNFFPKIEYKDMVILAGGIGITPFYSIIKNKIKTGFEKQITLIYSNKTVFGTAFFEKLNKLSKDNSNFKVIYCLTGEEIKNPLVKEYTRINEEIIKKYSDSLKDKDYYICGSVGFVNDMWKILKNIGVQENCIFTETFY
ncbi:MAG: FAD-dependent oxidoreductase [Candidatus Paceibacterota bacterium]|jgi:ferredoxin-NADP reductase